jgi:hypothetical protein
MSDHDMRLVTDSDGTPIPPIDMALDGDVQVTTTGNAPTVALVVATQEHGKISIPLAIGQSGPGLTPAGQVVVSDVAGGVAVDPNTALGSGKLTMVDPATPVHKAFAVDGTVGGNVKIYDDDGNLIVDFTRAAAGRLMEIFDEAGTLTFAVAATAAGLREAEIDDVGGHVIWRVNAQSGATRNIVTFDAAGNQLSVQTTAAAASANTHFGPGAGSTSAIMDFASTTQAVGLPVMSSVQKAAIVAPAKGFVVFDSTLNKLCVYTGAAWETVTSA